MINKIKKIVALSVVLFVSLRVMHELNWENRKEILKGKSIPYKIMWYMSNL